MATDNEAQAAAAAVSGVLMTDQGAVEMPDSMAASSTDVRDTRMLAGPPPEAVRLPLDSVQPNPQNPRQNETEIDDLAANIRRYGLMQPVLVRPISGAGEEERYELIAGHRRRMAFRHLRERYPTEAQWRTIPAVIRGTDSETAYMMLLSNQLHTKSFTPREEATALEWFGALGWTQERVGEVLSRSVPWVSKRMRIYQDPVLSGAVQAHRMAPGVADELIGVTSDARRAELAERAVAERWNQEQVRTAIRTETPTRTVQHVLRLLREATPLMRTLHPDDLSVNQQKEVWAFKDELTRLAQRAKRGEKRAAVFPNIDTLQGAATPRRVDDRRRRKPGLKVRID